MKKLTKKSIVLILSVAFAFSMAAFVFFTATAMAHADYTTETLVEGKFEIDGGVSLKLNSDGGMRFIVSMDSAVKNYVVGDEDVELGFIVAPKDLIDAAEGDYLNMSKKVCITVDKAKLYRDGDDWCANGCITNVYSGNRKFEFTAVGYILNGTEVQYTSLNDDARGTLYDVVNTSVLDQEYTEQIFALTSYNTWFATDYNFPIYIGDTAEYDALIDIINAGDALSGKTVRIKQGTTPTKEITGEDLPTIKNEFTVTLVNNNGESNTELNNILEGTTASVLYEQEMIPDNTGFDFNDWYITAVDGTPVTPSKAEKSDEIETDVELTAYWSNTDTADFAYNFDQSSASDYSVAFDGVSASAVTDVKIGNTAITTTVSDSKLVFGNSDIKTINYGDYNITLTYNETDRVANSYQKIRKVAVVTKILKTIANLINFPSLAKANYVDNNAKHYGGYYIMDRDITDSYQNLYNPSWGYDENTTDNNAFHGIFDGRGYSISGFYIYASVADVSYATGFFGAIGSKGIVRNVSLLDIVYTTTNCVNQAIVCGRNGGLVENVTVGYTKNADVRGKMTYPNIYVFGSFRYFAGANYYGEFKNCSFIISDSAITFSNENGSLSAFYFCCNANSNYTFTNCSVSKNGNAITVNTYTGKNDSTISVS